jgi:hypothetical protein
MEEAECAVEDEGGPRMSAVVPAPALGVVNAVAVDTDAGAGADDARATKEMASRKGAREKGRSRAGVARDWSRGGRREKTSRRTRSQRRGGACVRGSSSVPPLCALACCLVPLRVADPAGRSSGPPSRGGTGECGRPSERGSVDRPELVPGRRSQEVRRILTESLW